MQDICLTEDREWARATTHAVRSLESSAFIQGFAKSDAKEVDSSYDLMKAFGSECKVTSRLLVTPPHGEPPFTLPHNIEQQEILPNHNKFPPKL
jgi:hypothetical protein